VKLGIVADVHGDAVALRQALSLLDRQGAEQIVCAGDLVSKGSDAAGVIGLLQARAIPTVQGNHDADACSDGFILVYKNERDGIDMPYTESLSDEMRCYLRTLPSALRFEWEGKRIVMVHASTWDQNIIIKSEGDRALLERLATEADADVVILGHVHEPMRANVGRCIIVNPGCVYYGYPEFRSTCALLTLPECALTVFDVNTGAEVQVTR
jgi:putative phosphoesterase